MRPPQAFSLRRRKTIGLARPPKSETYNPSADAASPTTPTPKPAAIRIPSKVIGSVSLTDEMKGTGSNRAATTAPAKKEVPELTQELLDTIWQRMMTEVDLGAELKQLLADNKPMVTPDGTLEFETADMFFERNLRALHLPMLSYLREQTVRPNLEYKVRIRAANIDSKPYLPHDKFETMAKSNPTLKELRKLFTELKY